MDTEAVPLFALNTVLFPQGLLPLRIFEPRYLDMIGQCTSEDRGFGVLLIRSGAETGPPPTTEEVGTLAQVQDFEQRPDGLLGITVIGTRRFRLRSTTVQDDGLMVGRVEWIEEPEGVAVPAEHAALVNILRQTLDQLAAGGERTAPRYDDAAWVGYRLAEMLPVQLEVKQALLEIGDPVQRLVQLRSIIDGLRVV